MAQAARLIRITPEIHEAVICIARRAAAAILKVYAEDFDVQHKADNSPLTRADLAAHDIITEGLQRITPDVPLLSEEGPALPWSARQQWHTYWLIDPLDGTREFVKRRGEFTVNIALVQDHQPVFGVIQAPVTGTVWHAQAGRGALRRDGQNECVLHARAPSVCPLKVAVSRSYCDARTQAVLAQVPGCQGVPLGSSLKFCHLAEGALDVYPCLHPTNEWDTAAGQCILEAAGGALLATNGQAFRYNCRENLLNGDFIALGDASLPWRDWLTAAGQAA